ncbi:hypothetical protein EYZ11_003957 [Aspergillus tanneri]|uniref:LysM domain-containing protein n=1 Tax=Aspergillus tanneri TaxID=1220188 RepID=A0A4S3JM63_9EURO|nr:hypothetical protein EYZ11_003957 [Aspergillus tanneri]
MANIRSILLTLFSFVYLIANTFQVTLDQLREWNTFINAECTNLTIGDQLCVSDPNTNGGDPTTTKPTATMTGPYATATVAPPGPVAQGTTPRCGKYYQVQQGDYCQRIVGNSGISMELFKAINPDINADCSNLIPGLYYCVLPTKDWNSSPTTLKTTTSASGYVSPPGPTSIGTTPKCYEWYIVQQGDYCARIQSKYGVTMAQLQYWNPELNNECTNLLTGYAYCVRGDNQTNQRVAVAAVPAQTTGH